MPDIQELYNRLSNCDICPQDCQINRFENTDGTCGMGSKVRIASYGPHYGEEPEIVGLTASGTIFLSGCNLLCKFCQNCDISHERVGRDIDHYRLAEIMLNLQDSGVSNINFVTPTHFSPQLIKAVLKAKDNGLKIPIVYNSSGYDKVDTLKYWEGLVDIYMPDLKFVDPEKSKKYTEAENYFEIASEAVIEMHRQVGDLLVENETAVRGLLIRHLILPEDQSDTKQIIDFLADKIGTDTYLNLMEQYRPAYKAPEFPLLNRRITSEEYNHFIRYARERGFCRPYYIFE